MRAKHITVLGLGNILNRDEGVGVHAVQAMQRAWTPRFPAVEFIDGGTMGLDLLPIVEDATHLLLLDCVNAAQPPATLIELDKKQIPLYAQMKMSIHQITFHEVLGLAHWRNTMPRHLHLVGIQPQNLELGLELSPQIQAQLPQLLKNAERVLKRWTRAQTKEK